MNDSPGTKPICISIIIVNHNGKDVTVQCLRSLECITFNVPIEVIVIDNASTDGSIEMLSREFTYVILLSQNSNDGFGKANNIGASKARGKYLFFVNNDVVFQQDSITPLMTFLEERENAGVAAPMLLNADGTYQHSYGRFPSLINELRTKRDTALMKSIPDVRSPKEVDWVSFAAVIVRKQVFERLKGFDERYFMYFEDADLCCRLSKAGLKTYYCADVSLIHNRGKSWSSTNIYTLKKEYRRSQLLFYTLHRTWCDVILLRIYLLMKFTVLYVLTTGEERIRARSIISIALSSYANRS